jgi:nitrogen fixation protein NifU and related proteins
MTLDASAELYQQMILEHNKKPRNFGKLEGATHFAEGFNPLCGDHYTVYAKVDESGIIRATSFEGSGCAISKASASMMTMALKDKPVKDAEILFEEFHRLLTVAQEEPKTETLGRLRIFSSIWKYPSRVKCASLSWHAMKSALSGGQKVSTE